MSLTARALIAAAAGFAGAIATLALVVAVLPFPVWGQGHHGQGHAQGHHWYEKLKQPAAPGHSCCNADTPEKEGDCRPVKAYYDDLAERWIAHVDGRWQQVPPRVIVQDDSLNLEPFTAHACVSKGGVWYCFLRKQGGG